MRDPLYIFTDMSATSAEELETFLFVYMFCNFSCNVKFICIYINKSKYTKYVFKKNYLFCIKSTLLNIFFLIFIQSM